MVLLIVILLGGCSSTHSRAYPHHSVDEVWQAMLLTAETPDYSDLDESFRWSVVRNETWISPDEARLEIYRELERTIHEPLREPRHEERTWRMNVAIASEEPLRVYIGSNDWVIPMHIKEEADRFLNTMEQYLTDPPVTSDDGGAEEGDEPETIADDSNAPPVDLIDNDDMR